MNYHNAFLWVQTNAETITAFVAVIALILSSISVFISYISVRDQRKSNQATLRPLADILFDDYENKIAVKLLNNGIGPLILVSSGVYKNDTLISTDLIDVMPALPTGMFWKDFLKNLSGRIMDPSGSKTLICLNGDENETEFIMIREQIRDILKDLTIKISYKDVYENKFFFERKLDWFGRNI